nr:7-hydroxymethyl chlorophyll a reductase, chloroplastic [Tanacetum cinerariifolium]
QQEASQTFFEVQPACFGVDNFQIAFEEKRSPSVVNLPTIQITFIKVLEKVVHGRGRNADSLYDTYFELHEELLYARKIKHVEGPLRKF